MTAVASYSILAVCRFGKYPRVIALIVKTVASNLTMLVLGLVSLGYGRTKADGWTLWVIGALIGATAMAAPLVGWPPAVRVLRDVPGIERRLGRLFLPIVVGIMLLIFGALTIGGDVSTFAASVCGGFLVVFALHHAIYLSRNWAVVRSRMERSNAEPTDG